MPRGPHPLYGLLVEKLSECPVKQASLFLPSLQDPSKMSAVHRFLDSLPGILGMSAANVLLHVRGWVGEQDVAAFGGARAAAVAAAAEPLEIFVPVEVPDEPPRAETPPPSPPAPIRGRVVRMPDGRPLPPPMLRVYTDPVMHHAPERVAQHQADWEAYREAAGLPPSPIGAAAGGGAADPPAPPVLAEPNALLVALGLWPPAAAAAEAPPRLYRCNALGGGGGGGGAAEEAPPSPTETLEAPPDEAEAAAAGGGAAEPPPQEICTEYSCDCRVHRAVRLAHQRR